MNKKTKHIAMLVGLFSAAVHADELTNISPFVGMKGGWQLANDNLYKYTNINNYLLGIYGGLQFTPSLSWDLGYQYQGKLKADVTQVSIKTSLIESAIRYDWYFTDDISLYGRFGVTYWNMEKTQRLQLKEKGFSPLSELGVNYKLTQNMFFNAGYQYINEIGNSKVGVGEYDSHSIVIGVSYRFGGQGKVVVTSVDTIKPEDAFISTCPIIHIETMASTLLSSVEFGFDKVATNQDVRHKLTDTLLLLKKYPQARIEVIGYADPTGPSLYNKKLSNMRAEQFARILEKNGIEMSRMSVRGEGEVKLARGASSEEYAKSRRVDIQLLSFKYEVSI